MCAMTTGRIVLVIFSSWSQQRQFHGRDRSGLLLHMVTAVLSALQYHPGPTSHMQTASPVIDLGAPPSSW